MEEHHALTTENTTCGNASDMNASTYILLELMDAIWIYNSHCCQ